MNESFAAGLALGVGYIEVYEADVINPAYQQLLAEQRGALGIIPSAPKNLRIIP